MKDNLELDLNTFKSLIDNVYDEICIWDDNYKLLYVNKACYRHYGLTPDEMMGESLDYFLEKENYWSPSSLVYVYKEKKPVIQKQKTYLGIDITTISVPILDSNNNIKYVIQSDRDSQSELFKKLSPISRIESNGSEIGEKLIYKSYGMKSVAGYANKVAKVMAPLLILGETGTGKNVIAKYVHEKSLRHNKPFVCINMASINPTLIESELFGYKKGAFTGASAEGKKGLFEMANGGTLFLDEIAELPCDLQAKLLSVIQEEEVLPVGGVHSIKLDVRIISATNRDLAKLVEAGKFRQDLYHRLNVFELTIPPLRARKVDIPLLASYFLNIFNAKYNKSMNFSNKVMETFLNYSWGGNIRELSNIVERSVLISDENEISLTDLPDSFFNFGNMKDISIDDLDDMTLEAAMAIHEEAIVKKAYDKCGSSRKMATALQISQTKANRLIQKYLGDRKEKISDEPSE